ncbi:DUF6234 family protein [Kitasatospora sp. NPDC058263]
MDETPSRPGRLRRPARTGTGADVAPGLLLLLLVAGALVARLFDSGMEGWARSYDGPAGQEAIRRLHRRDGDFIGYEMAAVLVLAALAAWARRPWTAALLLLATAGLVAALVAQAHLSA